MRWVVLVVVLVTGIRLINLLETPVFGDEGLYCYLGYQINHLPPKDSANLVLNVWKDAPLLPVINALALKLFPSLLPLWTCRAAVTVIAGLGAIVLFGLGGWAAMLFYLLNPFNFFLDRTTLMEPVLNTAMLIFMAAALAAMKQGTKLSLTLAVFSTGLLLAAKQTGVLVLPIPLVWASLQPHKFPHLKRVGVIIAITAAGLIGLALTTTRLWDTAAMHTTTVISLVRIKTNLWLMANWLIQYWGWVVVPVIILGWHWRWALTVAYFILIFATVGWMLFPRYLLIIVPFMAILAAGATKNLVGKLLLAVLLAVFIIRDITILVNPTKAQLARETRYQFFEDWGSGWGTKAALDWLAQQQIDQQTVLLVPQDIQGLWVMSRLSWTPRLNLETRFYTTAANLINQVETSKEQPVWLVATAHHWQQVNAVKQFYLTKKLLATNGEAGNSVVIEEVKP